MSSVAEHVPFLHLCKLCQKISERKGKDKKLQPLKDFIQYWRNFHDKLHANAQNTTDSFFPAMRLLLPQCERQRTAYGIKEFTLAKLLIDIFCLDKNSEDAKKLINYRSPKSANADAGDFASVAYFVLKNRSPEKGDLTVHDINFRLDCIASNHAEKNKDALKDDLLHLLRNTSALEQKWLIRMILKDMKLGISENTVMAAFHVDARSLFDVSNSLEKICISLRDPAARLNEIEISLFSPFRPMLSEMALPNQAEELMKGKPFVIETKYDGERLQLHKKETTYMYFSRGGFDCTSTYGGSPLQGSLTPFIHKSFKPGVKSCILDGEIVIYSNKLNCIVAKGENADVQALHLDGDYQPCFCVFDILMLNDQILSNCPLTERVARIRDVFSPIENKIRYTEQLQASNNNEVLEELNKAIESRLEGIIVKRLDSTYRPNGRKGGGWLKVKPEYIENLMDELDLLIIGGYYGEGRRSNLVSHFLVGVASPEQIDGHPKCFYSVSKVGSGYTLKELHELSGKLSDHWQPYNPKKPPKCLVVGREQPDMWIEPSKSQIVQVKASEINRSKSFATNCTLRFPRVEKIRYDKPWHDCMTTTELEDLRNLAQGRLATRLSTVSDDAEEPIVKKQKLQKDRVTSVAPHFRPTDMNNVQKVSELFKDKEMCVVFASLDKKQDMEKKIMQHGGKLVQNPGSNTYCVVCDKVTVKANNIISTDSYDVIKSVWINNCIASESLLTWIPDDFYHASEKTREGLGKSFDKYGDSYTENVTEAELQKIFQGISQDDWMKEDLTSSDVTQLEKTYFPGSSQYGLFRECRFCFYNESHQALPYDELDTETKLLYFQLKLHGANMLESIDDSTTHVIVHQISGEKVMPLSKETENKSPYFVPKQWALDCIKEKKLLNVEDFCGEENCGEEGNLSSDESLFSF